MSKYLDRAACLDPERAEALAANDRAMGIQPMVLRAFAVSIKAGKSVRVQFECMARSSVEALMQHADLKADDEYIVVRALEAA